MALFWNKIMHVTGMSFRDIYLHIAQNWLSSQKTKDMTPTWKLIIKINQFSNALFPAWSSKCF